MNPWDLSASELLTWGILLHLIADWPLQNDWMANNKMKRRARRIDTDRDVRVRWPRWWDRHTAAYIHAGIHGLLLMLIFGWVATPLAIVHLIIDTRWPVIRWSQFIKQTQPRLPLWPEKDVDENNRNAYFLFNVGKGAPMMDMGMEVRIWTDQVFHMTCIVIAALLVGV